MCVPILASRHLKIINKEMFLTGEGKVQKLQKKNDLGKIQAKMRFIPEPPG